MREIKFRGRAVTYTKELDDAWVYGSLIENGACPFIVGGGTKVDEDDDGFVLEHQRWAEVIPETVGEFTGLKDKNGREMYEGDVVTGKREGGWHGGIEHVKAVIKYRSELAGFDLDSSFSRALHSGGEIHGVEELEVIGNIHDNPELLEGSLC